MKTVDIKGREYVMVNERIKFFRDNYRGYALLSEIVDLTDDRCVIKATILNPEGAPVANGIAYENQGSTFINKTSYIENCETSAWGRALGNMGIGVDASIASAEEVQNAIANQKPAPPTAPKGMTDKQKNAILAAGKKRDLTDRETMAIVAWAAKVKKMPEDSSGAAELFIGKNDDGKWKFDIIMESYLEAAKAAA
jgi:hypothetical protein